MGPLKTLIFLQGDVADWLDSNLIWLGLTWVLTGFRLDLAVFLCFERGAKGIVFFNKPEWFLIIRLLNLPNTISRFSEIATTAQRICASYNVLTTVLRPYGRRRDGFMLLHINGKLRMIRLTLNSARATKQVLSNSGNKK